MKLVFVCTWRAIREIGRTSANSMLSLLYSVPKHSLSTTPRSHGATRSHGALHRVHTPPPSPVAMFSPEASIQSARSSLRNPRRRPRESDGPQQQSRRKRSKISDDSFVAKDEAHVNGNGSALMNGHGGANGSAENSMVVIDMPVREKKSASKRIAKEDHSLYLVSHCETPCTGRPLITLEF